MENETLDPRSPVEVRYDGRHQWVSGSARSSCHEKGRLANASKSVWRARWSVIAIADMEESTVLFPTKRKLCFNQLRKES